MYITPALWVIVRNAVGKKTKALQAPRDRRKVLNRSPIYCMVQRYLESGFAIPPRDLVKLRAPAQRMNIRQGECDRASKSLGYIGEA